MGRGCDRLIVLADPGDEYDPARLVNARMETGRFAGRTYKIERKSIAAAVNSGVRSVAPCGLAHHGPMVMRVCRGVMNKAHHAEDAFQAVFLVLANRAR